MHSNTNLSMFCFHWVVGLVCLSLSTASDDAQPSQDSCLLQQRSASERSSKDILEELPSTQSKMAPSTIAKSAPSSGGISLAATRPTGYPKSAPRPGGKGRSEPSKEAPTTTPPSDRIHSTDIEDIVDDDFMSQRGELHLAVGLQSLQESSGSLKEFGNTLHDELSEIANVDPSRVKILGMRGDYIDPDVDDSTNTRLETGAQVDFEIYPGASGDPTPGQSIKRVAKSLTDMRDNRAGRFAEGPLEDAFRGAAMTVTQGTKIRDLSPEFGTEASRRQKAIGVDGNTRWYPWDWFRSLWSEWRSDATTGSLHYAALLLVLSLWVPAALPI